MLSLKSPPYFGAETPRKGKSFQVRQFKMTSALGLVIYQGSEQLGLGYMGGKNVSLASNEKLRLCHVLVWIHMYINRLIQVT